MTHAIYEYHQTTCWQGKVNEGDRQFQCGGNLPHIRYILHQGYAAAGENQAKGMGVSFVETDRVAFARTVEPLYQQMKQQKPDIYALVEQIRRHP